MGHRYEVYGLQVRSTEPLRGLLLGQSAMEPDLDIIWCRDEGEQLTESRQWTALSMSLQPHSVTPVKLWRSNNAGGELLRLSYSVDNSVCDFVFDQVERKLWVIFPGVITRGRLRSFLLGSVISSILRLRGTICLHASVVSLKQQAIAFAGRKGDGKSTTAVALAQRGAAVLSDDIAAIRQDHGRFVVHPGEMDVRLLESSVGALYGGSDASAKAAGIDGKVRVRLSEEAGQFGRFARHALPLAAIYLFADGAASDALPSISLVRPGDRYMSLFQHFYGFWLNKDLTHIPDFKTLSQLVNAVPVYRIDRRKKLEQLPSLCDAIIKNLSEQDEGGALQLASGS